MTLKDLDEAMTAMYAKPTSAADYTRMANTMEYDSERAMFESYSRNKYESTGVIQWMLNNAWPSMIWHLYDYNLEADAGYYAVKNACAAAAHPVFLRRPVHRGRQQHLPSCGRPARHRRRPRHPLERALPHHRCR